MTAVVDYRSLNQGGLVELARGGEGLVFSIAGQPALVYKEFMASCATTPDRSALEELIAAPFGLPDSDREWLLSRTIWPHTMVLDGARLRGFLMPRIGNEFYRRHGIRAYPKIVPCEWNFLLMRGSYESNPLVVSDVPRLDTANTLELVFDLAKTVAVLHRNKIIIGDISGRNLLWTTAPKPRAMIIDCDGFRLAGGGGVGTPKQSPDWEDPQLGGKPTTLDSDIYKLGLAAYRALWPVATDRPSAGALQRSLPVGVPDAVAELIARSTSPSGRPSAEEWVTCLRETVLLFGRPSVVMHPSAPVVAPPGPRGDNQTRPVISMTPKP